MMQPATIRQIRAGEWPQLRALRLQALADAPMAFGTVLTDAERFADRYWQQAAANGASGDERITFVAESPGGWLGMTNGTVEEIAPQLESITVAVTSVWVHPSARGKGVAAALVHAVEDWAAERGATRLELHVTESNTAALALYFRLGFHPTGQTLPLPHTPSVRELHMRAELPLRR